MTAFTLASSSVNALQTSPQAPVPKKWRRATYVDTLEEKPDTAARPPADVEGLPAPGDSKNNVLKFIPAALRRDPGAKESACAFSAASVEAATHLTQDAEHAYPELAATYWDDPRIHGFGNRGAWGAFHAVVAPSFTVALDVFAYGGVDVRKVAWNRIVAQRAARGAPDIAKAVDLGTGTGPTARSLARSFPGADIAAVDTSPEMLKAAADIASLEVDLDGIAFMRGNAEATGLARGSSDLVAVFFLLHEAPADARARILEEAHALVAPGGTLAVCDIHPSYVPSPTMAMGEPYVAGYLRLTALAEQGATGGDSQQQRQPRPTAQSGWQGAAVPRVVERVARRVQARLGHLRGGGFRGNDRAKKKRRHRPGASCSAPGACRAS